MRSFGLGRGGRSGGGDGGRSGNGGWRGGRVGWCWRVDRRQMFELGLW